MQWCLERSRTENPERSVIVIRDSSISHISNKDLEDLVVHIASNDKNYDLFYLSRHQDDCQKLINVNEYKYGIQTARTYEASRALRLYTSQSRVEILY